MFRTFFIRVRILITDPFTDWVTAILSFATGLVAILVLVAQLPIIPPELAAWLVSIVAFLNALIALLKRLIPVS